MLVGGSGRNGTTVLARLLAAGPGVDLVPRELRVHSDPGGLSDTVRGDMPLDWCLERLRDDWISRTSAKGQPRGLTRFLEVPAYHRAVDAFAREFATDPHRAARELIEVLVSSGPPRSGGSWVEMSPTNCRAADRLQLILPEAHFVHVVRSGLDVAASYQLKRWGPDDLLECVSHWADRTADAARAMLEVTPERRSTIPFEHLVTRSDATLDLLLGRVGWARGPEHDGFLSQCLDPERAHIGRWQELSLDVRERAVALAVYIAETERIRMIDAAAVPVDWRSARQLFGSMPPRERSRATVDAAAHRALWRWTRGNRWSWRPTRYRRVRRRMHRLMRLRRLSPAGPWTPSP